jgi:hypothetical protein
VACGDKFQSGFAMVGADNFVAETLEHACHEFTSKSASVRHAHSTKMALTSHRPQLA